MAGQKVANRLGFLRFQRYFKIPGRFIDTIKPPRVVVKDPQPILRDHVHERLGRGPHPWPDPQHLLAGGPLAKVRVHRALHERVVEDAVDLAIGLARDDVVDLRALRVQTAAVTDVRVVRVFALKA